MNQYLKLEPRNWDFYCLEQMEFYYDNITFDKNNFIIYIDQFINSLSDNDKITLIKNFQNYIHKNDNYDFLTNDFKEYFKNIEYIFDYMIFVPELAYYMVTHLNLNVNLLPKEIKNIILFRYRTKSGRK